MLVVKVEGNLTFRYSRGAEGNWIAVSDPLGLTFQAEKWADLVGDIAETLNSMLGDLMLSGELSKFLRERGWRPLGRLPERPADVWFDVPFNISAADRDSNRTLYQ